MRRNPTRTGAQPFRPSPPVPPDKRSGPQSALPVRSIAADESCDDVRTGANVDHGPGELHQQGQTGQDDRSFALFGAVTTCSIAIRRRFRMAPSSLRPTVPITTWSAVHSSSVQPISTDEELGP